MARSTKDRALPNNRHEHFCHLFVFGNPKHDPKDKENTPPDTFHNATQAYRAAGFKGDDHVCGVGGHRLLRRDDIQTRLVELRTEQTRIKTAFLESWKSMLPDAQDVIRRAMAGEEISTQCLTAAREVIEQAQGPTRFRFGVDKGADDAVSGLHVTLWSGRKE